MARVTRPGPPLYDASARCQSSKMPFSVFKYLAAARVAFSGSERSSMYQSWRSPFSTPVPGMNCQTPLAFARESAVGLKALSTSGTKARSSGRALGSEHVLNHRQVLRATRQAAGQELAKPALEQLHVAEDAVVQRDRNVVSGFLKVGLDVFGGARRWRRGIEREELVDRGRFGDLLGETVAGGQRGQLERGNAIDQPVEVFADARDRNARPAAIRATLSSALLKCDFARCQVAKRQFLAAFFELPIGSGQQLLNRINRRTSSVVDGAGGCASAAGGATTATRPRPDEHATLTTQ